MISKERLEELIEQGATIYKIRDNMIIDYQLCSYNYLEDNELIYENVITNYCRSWIGKLDDFFETEEDAKWELEMTATRTETLKLPNWEEFRKLGEFTFYGFHQGKIKMFYNISDDEIKIDTGKDWYIFYKKYNKENYIEACKLCLRLFKGEEV